MDATNDGTETKHIGITGVNLVSSYNILHSHAGQTQLLEDSDGSGESHEIRVPGTSCCFRSGLGLC